MNKNFKTYLESVGLDPDELCNHWAEKMEQGIKDQYERAKGKNRIPFYGFKMRPLTYDEIMNSNTDWMKDRYTKMLGKEVHCDYSDSSGLLVGIYTDELDYYYAIDVDGKIIYHSCVGGIYLVRNI